MAIFTLQVRSGFAADAGDILTNQVVNLVRRSGAFQSVLSSSELSAVAGLELQKQLLDCNNNACVAELAGGLAVSHIITGSVGQLGESLLLDLKLIRVAGAVNAVSVSRRVRSGPKAADQLLDVLPGAVEELLGSAGLRAQGEGTDGSRRAWPRGVVAAGAATAAAAALPLVTALGLAVVNGVFVLAVYGMVPLPVGAVSFWARLATAGGLAVASGILGVGTLAMVALGVGLLAAGIWGWSQP